MKQKSLVLNTIVYIIKIISSLLFPMITFPYISRVLNVQGIGKYNFSNAYVSYFVLLAGLGIATYAVRDGSQFREDSEQFQKFSQEVFTINVFSSVCSELLLVFSLFTIKQLFDYRYIILILSMTIFLTLIGTEWIFTIYEDFIYITLRGICIQIISLILMIILVKNESDVLIYCIICVFASAGGNLLNFKRARKYFKHRVVKLVDCKFHVKPIMILFFSLVASQIYINSDVVMIGFFKNDYEVGIYSAASKIYNIIRSVLCAIITVLLPRLSYLKKTKFEDAYSSLLIKSLSAFFLICFPASIGLALISKGTIVVFCGKNYIAAVGSLIVLAVALLFSCLGSFIANTVLVVHEKEKTILVATIIGAVLNILLNVFFIKYWGGFGAAITTLISEVVVFGIQLYYVNQIVHTNLIIYKDMIKTVVATIIMCGVGVYVLSLRYSPVREMMIIIPICSMIYVLLLLLTKHSMIYEFRKIICMVVQTRKD